jgi:hypothetical protein
MPIAVFIKQLEAAAQLDSRTELGGDIQRCLMWGAHYRLKLLVEKVDPAPWRSTWTKIRDAWAVLKNRAVAVHVIGSVLDV